MESECTTFFVCTAAELRRGFPGWLPPLPKPVRRRMKMGNGKVLEIETQDPLWPADHVVPDPEYCSASGAEGYDDFLSARLRPFIRACPHWIARDLQDSEVNPLSAVLGVEAPMKRVLFGPPASWGCVDQLPSESLSRLSGLDRQGLEDAARRWAAVMSSPKNTQPLIMDVKMTDGWTVREARELLGPLAALARRAKGEQKIYLLVDAA